VSLVPVVAWIAAVVLAAVVLSFCGYEVWWKTRRFQRDLARLTALQERVAQLQAELGGVQERSARALRAVTD
jgi:hypothetical protein